MPAIRWLAALAVTLAGSSWADQGAPGWETIRNDAGIQVSRKVVPGSPFFVTPGARHHLRLSFGNRSEALIEAGMRTLGAVVGELAATPARRPHPPVPPP